MRDVLAPLAACGFLGLAVGALVAPRALSRNFGLPVDDEAGNAYVGSLGARDGVLGLLILTFWYTENRPALEATLGLSALAGASDFVLVSRVRGPSAAPNLLIHGGGTLALLAIWAAVRRSGEAE